MSDVIESANAAQVLLDRHITAAEGNRTALKFGDKRYSYNDLAAIANRTGNMLKRCGMGPGRCVLLVAPPSPAYAATILGAMKAGGWAAVVEGPIQQASLAAALRAAEPALAVVHHEHVGAIEGAGATVDVVVIGAHGNHQSFVDLVREQPSSLAVAAVERPATAIALVKDGTVQSYSHHDLSRGIADRGGPSGSKTLGLLDALAKGQEFILS
jgi:acyl-coenzyme A synthetase/AMP-(fatty) acid ligase